MDKVACVIGSSGGIGAACVARLKADGWSGVIEMDLKGPIKIDVSDPESVAAAFSEVREQHLEIDLLIVASGILDLRHISETSFEHWTRVLSVNLTGPFLCAKEADGMIRNHGNVILISSLAARTGGHFTGISYAASKGGIESLTKSLAHEFAGRRIRVNCIAPGGIDTPMLAQNPPESLNALVRTTPLGRLGHPNDIAGVVAFLASADANYMTGMTIGVNGGRLMD